MNYTFLNSLMIQYKHKLLIVGRDGYRIIVDFVLVLNGILERLGKVYCHDNRKTT